jgi:phenylpyruvate tautomerase PptA (4-oxalocrotonate tautomerase family)
MPIVTVEVVAAADYAMEKNLAQSLADAVGRVLNSPPGQTWIRLRLLGRDQYAESESVADGGELPVFVTILKRQSPLGGELEAEVTELTRTIARVIGRPAACVHIEYAPAAVGRVSFGGRLVQ